MGVRVVRLRALLALGLVLGLLGSAGAAPPAPPAPTLNGLLAPYEATYRLQQGPLTLARATFALRRADGDVWTLTSRTEATGWLGALRDDRITETSRFRVTDDRLLPLAYEMHHTGPDGTKTETADFDWAARRVRGRVNEAAYDLPLTEHTYDRLSLQVVVRAAAARGISPVKVSMLEKNKIKPVRFEQGALETVQTAAGRFVAVRMGQVDSKKPMRFWLAPTANHLPVRVEQDRGKLHLKLELERLDLAGTGRG